MDRNVTVSVKGLLVSALAVLALVVAYLLGGAGDGAGAAASAGPGDPAAAAAAAAVGAGPGTLTMGGAGEATAVPDQLVFDLTVGVTRPDLDDALEEASRTTERAFDAVAAHGAERGDVRTTGLAMNPVYDYHDHSPPTLRGYRVTQRAQVLVDELKDGGAAISAVVASGANAVRVSGIQLRIGDPDAVLARARKSAVQEATAKAEEYAAATGQELGSVVTLREVPVPAGRGGLQRARATASYDSAAELSAVPIRSGREELSVRVEVVWELA